MINEVNGSMSHTHTMKERLDREFHFCINNSVKYTRVRYVKK